MLGHGALGQLPLGGEVTTGTFYSVSITEAATAVTTQSALATYPATEAESGTATEIESVIATFAASETETGTALDTPSAVATYPASETEAATASDGPTADDADAASIIESASATDTVDGPVDEGIRGSDNGFVGGTFSRGRWHSILEAERAALEAERTAKQLRKRKERELALAAADEARKAVLAARQAQHDDWLEQEHIRQLTAALSGFNSAQNIQDVMRHSKAMTDAAQAHHQRMMENDEDEAISLLMLHG